VISNILLSAEWCALISASKTKSRTAMHPPDTSIGSIAWLDVSFSGSSEFSILGGDWGKWCMMRVGDSPDTDDRAAHCPNSVHQPVLAGKLERDH